MRRRTLRYVELLSEARTPLAAFFSVLLGFSAFRARAGFFCCLTLFGGQGEKLLALPAGANFKVGGSLVIDVGGQEQLQGVISDRNAIGEFDDSQTIVKDFKVPFLPFSGQDMPEDEHRLSLTFRTEVSQGVLCVRRAGKLSTGAGSKDRRRHNGRSCE